MKLTKHIFTFSLIGLMLVMPGLLLADGKGMFDFNDDLLKRVEKKYGKEAVVRLQNLSKLIKEKASGSEMDKVEYVNNYFNQISYYSDLKHWKKKDYWATPFEKITTNGGDCEDYSIGKYYTLRELGIPDKKLRMMYVKAIKWGEAHMVLTYFPKENDIPLVLDNINKELLPATKRKDLVPVYSFNGDGLWIAKSKGSGKRVGNASKLNLWSDLMKRAEN